MTLRTLPRSFYLQPTIKVAKGLLGCFLVRRIGSHRMVARIVEVEAYLGSRDPASHAYRGSTQRNEVMFRRGGHLYVYFTYGMHFCANVVTEEEGTGHAVLLRAVEPVAGTELMWRRRKLSRVHSPVNLTNGPAKLCEAFGIQRKENGTDLLGRHIWIGRNNKEEQRVRVGTSTRIGISRAKGYRWRFYIINNRFVSRGKPSTTGE